MIYEFIATITAGFGMAGLALIIRHLSKLAGKQAPKWLVPVFIGIGMLGFQIHQEYYWYDLTASRLPDSVEVIKTSQGQAWYKPWSYIKPQTVRFMALDTQNIETNQHNPNLKMVNLYLFERRMSAEQRSQIIDCTNRKRADYNLEATDENPAELVWFDLDDSDPILAYACQ